MLLRVGRHLLAKEWDRNEVDIETKGTNTVFKTNSRAPALWGLWTQATFSLVQTSIFISPGYPQTPQLTSPYLTHLSRPHFISAIAPLA